jgi:hypothetical protein
MPLPNFFVIGAAKAGTTALYDSLKQHPEIYMSPIKEPFFFAFQGEPPIFAGPAGTFFRRTAVRRPRDYMLLFGAAMNQHAIGEASSIYLRSPLAARRIQKNLPQSKIVAILRHPAERAYSHYMFMVQQNAEPAPTFERALAHEVSRIEEGWFPGLFHKTNGYYHAQLSVYFDLFPCEQIKVYLYEDWKGTPRTMLRDLFGFLQVDETFSPELRQRNVTLLPKNRRLHQLAINSEGIERRLTPLVPASGRSKIVSALRWFDKRYNLAPPPPLDPEIRARLTADYREDILKLQDLIGRDLSHWLRTT